MNEHTPANADNARKLKALEDRIEELGNKASQLLLFLSFALVVAAILETQGNKLGPHQTAFVAISMRFWAGAIFPILISILPAKEIRENDTRWYNFVRWSNLTLLWVAVFSVFVGGVFFLLGIWRIGSQA